MKTLTLINKGIGKNGYWEVRDELNKFVHEHFDTLYEGACRLPSSIVQTIGEDYYAPQRVQINQTRLHRHQGLKYADGHKRSSDYHPTEEQLINTVKDLQTLLDSAGKNIPQPFKIHIIKEDKENNKAEETI